MEQTEKIFVGSGIWFASWDQERGSGSGLLDACWIKSSIFSALFNGIRHVVANRSIVRQFSELWHHEDCAHKKMARLILNRQLSLISGPWHSIGAGVSSPVLSTYYPTSLNRVFVPSLVSVCCVWIFKSVFRIPLNKLSVQLSFLYMFVTTLLSTDNRISDSSVLLKSWYHTYRILYQRALYWSTYTTFFCYIECRLKAPIFQSH